MSRRAANSSVDRDLCVGLMQEFGMFFFTRGAAKGRKQNVTRLARLAVCSDGREQVGGKQRLVRRVG